MATSAEHAAALVVRVRGELDMATAAGAWAAVSDVIIGAGAGSWSST
jgi:anti-anti-sigma regulatory factor